MNQTHWMAGTQVKCSKLHETSWFPNHPRSSGRFFSAGRRARRRCRETSSYRAQAFRGSQVGPKGRQRRVEAEFDGNTMCWIHLAPIHPQASPRAKTRNPPEHQEQMGPVFGSKPLLLGYAWRCSGSLDFPKQVGQLPGLV